MRETHSWEQRLQHLTVIIDNMMDQTESKVKLYPSIDHRKLWYDLQQPPESLCNMWWVYEGRVPSNSAQQLMLQHYQKQPHKFTETMQREERAWREQMVRLAEATALVEKSRVRTEHQCSVGEGPLEDRAAETVVEMIAKLRKEAPGVVAG